MVPLLLSEKKEMVSGSKIFVSHTNRKEKAMIIIGRFDV